MQWMTTNRLPEHEPNAADDAAYASPQLLSGASDDGRFVYDAVWLREEACFVLTLLWVNEELGFVEDTVRLYPTTRVALLTEVARFQAAPESCFA